MPVGIRRRPRETDSDNEPSSRALPRRWLIAGAVAAGALAVGIGLVVGGAAGERVGSGLSPPASQPPRAPAPPDAPPGFVRFRADGGLFSIAYPADWMRLDARDANVELLVTGKRAASLLARAIPLRFRVDRRNLPAIKDLTDRIVASGRRVRLLAQERRVELGGLPGYFYLYSFRDDSGRRGTHSHYFLFRGDTMITLVFQALPASRFDHFAPLFDRMASTFRAQVP